MILGIDASNIRAGGGVTHLVELLKIAEPDRYGFSKVIIWSVDSTLNRIENRPWLEKSSPTLLKKNFFSRSLWQIFKLTKLACSENCDVLFIPGGSFFSSFSKVVTMSQNLLPFEWKELKRNGFSLASLRFLLLRYLHSHSFRKANGIIFLTKYSQDTIKKVIKRSNGETVIIPHGIDVHFTCKPKKQLPISDYSIQNPYRIIYVSTINAYKHQWHVAESIYMLRKNCLPVSLLLIGPSTPKSMLRLQNTLLEIDPESNFIQYLGPLPYNDIPLHYSKADLCLFASSCENMPIILLEGMASGLPIACSNKGPMPEILGDAGVYFEPEDPHHIANTLIKVIKSPELRTKLCQRSFERAQLFSWDRCANDTFKFIAKITRS